MQGSLFHTLTNKISDKSSNNHSTSSLLKNSIHISKKGVTHKLKALKLFKSKLREEGSRIQLSKKLKSIRKNKPKIEVVNIEEEPSPKASKTIHSTSFENQKRVNQFFCRFSVPDRKVLFKLNWKKQQQKLRLLKKQQKPAKSALTTLKQQNNKPKSQFTKSMGVVMKEIISFETTLNSFVMSTHSQTLVEQDFLVSEQQKKEINREMRTGFILLSENYQEVSNKHPNVLSLGIVLNACAKARLSSAVFFKIIKRFDHKNRVLCRELLGYSTNDVFRTVLRSK